MKFDAISPDLLIKIGLGAGVVLGVLYLISRMGSAEDMAAGAGSAAADVVVGTAAGAVNTAGSYFGIPMQNDAQCEIDMANGNTMAAMSSCRVAVFAKYLANGAPVNTGGATGSW